MRPTFAILAGLTLLLVAGCDEQPATGGADPGSAAQPAGLGFVPPPPGSYALPPIQAAADGDVLDTAGARRRLSDFLGDRDVVLSFVYTSCNDPSACPMARRVFSRLERELRERPSLAGRVRLVTLSFDPERDTPEVMARYADPGGLRAGGSEESWRFLTTASQGDLQPILDGYGQLVVPEVGPDGRASGVLAHMLKVFLIDRQGRVRNVYSSDFLHPELVVNDLETLRLEEEAAAREREAALAAFDRLALARLAEPPLGLPPVPSPAGAPPAAAEVRLGRKLFLDRRLSFNGSLSCAMCHVPEQGFASNELRTAVGFEGRTLLRNSPSLLNAAYAGPWFHDGREPDLDLQAFDVFVNPDEMAAPSLGWVVERVRSTPEYPPLFAEAFGEPPTAATVGRALGTYMRSLVSGDSPFDRWYYGGDEGALSEEARRGFALFTGAAGCASCHRVGEASALFTDHGFHDTGVGRAAAMKASRRDEPVRIELAPGVTTEVARALVESVGKPVPPDLGRYRVTAAPEDLWRFKTPILRNVALTAPYMHDGSLSTLEEAVEHYDRGGLPGEGQDPRLRPLGLSATEKADLVAFLESLTGANAAELVADARSERIGNPGGER